MILKLFCVSFGQWQWASPNSQAPALLTRWWIFSISFTPHLMTSSKLWCVQSRNYEMLVSAITEILLPLFVTRSHQIAQKSMKTPSHRRYGSLRSTERERDQSLGKLPAWRWTWSASVTRLKSAFLSLKLASSWLPF